MTQDISQRLKSSFTSLKDWDSETPFHISKKMLPAIFMTINAHPFHLIAIYLS